ncbi:MAG: isoprenylcysteine carboxylmethyltransferase family protein, partial [Pirellulales bacterium]|nr:isoprenylcysteine carboxylmethyltransferase family protein [Pirellulales bacterium]
MEPSLPYRVAVVAVFVLMRLARVQVRHRVGWKANWQGMKKNPLDTVILIAWGLGTLPVLALYIGWPGTIAWADVALPGLVRWAGVGISLIGLGLLVWTDKTLGDNLSVTLQIVPNQQLITTGPYRHVRHPIYVAGLLVFVGVSITSANALLAGVCLGGYALFLITRIPREERMMQTHFGQAYDDY